MFETLKALWANKGLSRCKCCGWTASGCYWNKKENWEHKSKCRQCNQVEIVWHGKIAPANGKFYYCEPCWAAFQLQAVEHRSIVNTKAIDREQHDLLFSTQETEAGCTVITEKAMAPSVREKEIA